MTTRVRAGGIAGDTITTSMMQNDIVTNAKMADDAVDSDVLANTIVLADAQIAMPGMPIQYSKAHFQTGEGTTSTSFQDATGASIAFACKKSNSLVKITAGLMVGGKGKLRILAGTTDLMPASNGYVFYNNESQTNWNSSSHRQMTYLSAFHEPASTSSVTYKLQYAAYTGQAFGVNELYNSSSYVYSFIECMEIAQ